MPAYLEEPKFVRRAGGPHDDGLDVSDVDIVACYGKSCAPRLMSAASDDGDSSSCHVQRSVFRWIPEISYAKLSGVFPKSEEAQPRKAVGFLL